MTQLHRDRSEYRAQVRRIVRRLGGKYALSWPVILIVLGPSAALTVWIEFPRHGGNFNDYFTIVVQSLLAATLVAMAFRYTVLPVRARPSRPVLAVVAYFAMSFAYNVTESLAVWGEGFTRSFASNYVDQVPGAVSGTLLLIITAMVVDAWFANRDSFRQLSLISEELEGAGERTRAEVLLTRAELAEQTQQVVTPSLTRLQARIDRATSLEEMSLLAYDLRETASGEIRGMSHRLMDDAYGMDIAERSVALPSVPPGAGLGQSILPGTTTAVVAMLAVVPVTDQMGVGWGLFQVIAASAVVYAVLLGFRMLVAGVRVSATGAMAFGALAQILVVSVVVDFAADRILGWPIDVTQAVTAGTVVLSAMTGAMFLLDYRRVRRVARIAAANARLRAEISRRQQAVWLAHRRLAQVLHGPVQSAMQAAALRITAADHVDDELRAATRRDLANALDGIWHPYESLGSGATDLRDIQQVWEGVSRIEFDPADLEGMCARMPETTRAIWVEAVREAIGNAIVHGGATHVVVRTAVHELGAVDGAELRYTVTDDGRGLSVGAKRGNGSRFLDSVAVHWSLARIGSGEAARTELSVVLPMAQGAAVAAAG